MNQPLPLREQLKALEHLQELDQKIDALKNKKGALPAALKALDEAYSKLFNSTEAKKKAIEEIDKLQRQTQAAMDLNRDRLARANSKLEGVHNGQEFNAANKEIDQLKKLNTTLEEQLKKSKDDATLASKDLEQLDGQFGKIKEDRESQSQVISGQAGQLETEIQGLMKERAQYTAKVEGRILSVYDRVRVARGGVGFVPAVGGRCSGCNMMVPAQLYNEVQRAQQVQACPSCHRILFVPQSQASGQGT